MGNFNKEETLKSNDVILEVLRNKLKEKQIQSQYNIIAISIGAMLVLK
jgi:hypothetical protein